MKKYKSVFKLEEGASRVKVFDLVKLIENAMQDIINGAEGKNLSKDSPHPDAQSIKAAAYKIIQDAQQFKPVKGEIWLRGRFG